METFEEYLSSHAATSVTHTSSKSVKGPHCTAGVAALHNSILVTTAPGGRLLPETPSHGTVGGISISHGCYVSYPYIF